MRSILALPVLALLIPAAPARARDLPPVRASYAAYAGGLNVLNLEVGLGIQNGAYRAVTTFRTAGLLATFVRGEQTSIAEGRADAALVPTTYRMDGLWRGNPRRIAVDYAAGRPEVRALVPPNEAEREAVPAAAQAGTVDTLTALAALIRQVASGGGCALRLATYDGRRRVEFSARDAGTEALARNPYNSFAGEAVRCEIEGRQTAGFRRDQNRAEAAAPQVVRVWLAPMAPGGSPIPVRMEFDTSWVGTVYVHLTSVAAGLPAVPAPRAGN